VIAPKPLSRPHYLLALLALHLLERLLAALARLTDRMAPTEEAWDGNGDREP